MVNCWRQPAGPKKRLADYTTALAQMPQDAELYAMRGEANHRLGKYDDALADLSQSIEIAPHNAVAYAQRGNVHAELGDYERAISDFRQALAIDARVGRSPSQPGLVAGDLPGSYVSQPSASAGLGRAGSTAGSAGRSIHARRPGGGSRQCGPIRSRRSLPAGSDRQRARRFRRSHSASGSRSTSSIARSATARTTSSTKTCAPLRSKPRPTRRASNSSTAAANW